MTAGRFLVLSGIVVALTACASAATPVPGGPSPLPPQAGCRAAAVPDALCVLVIGDSLAEGTPITGNDRWWSRLQAMLVAAMPGRAVVIDSWAVSGSQVAVLESAARDQPEVGTYSLAIVIEGVNDAHLLPLKAWRQRYEAALVSLEARGLTVIITTPPPRFENGAFDPRYDGVAAAVRALAVEGRPLLDIGHRWRRDGIAVARAYYVDPIHQSIAGQQLMATMARDIVLEAIGGESAQ